jgi:hypothetical protein
LQAKAFTLLHMGKLKQSLPFMEEAHKFAEFMKPMVKFFAFYVMPCSAQAEPKRHEQQLLVQFSNDSTPCKSSCGIDSV